MQPGQLPGLGGLPSQQSHDLRDPRRPAQSQQGLYGQHGVSAQSTGQAGATLYSAGLFVSSFPPQQASMNVPLSQPGIPQHLQNPTSVQSYGGNLPMAQQPMHQFVMPQLQPFAPQVAAQAQQQPLWSANTTSVGPVSNGRPVQPTQHGLQPVHLQQPVGPRPMGMGMAAAAGNTAVNFSTPTYALGVAQPQPPSLRQQALQPAVQQHQQQYPQQPFGTLGSAASHASGPTAAATLSTGVSGLPLVAASGPSSGPSGGGSGAAAGDGSSPLGPRPMKRQAYQGLQGNAAKRHQQQRGMTSNSVGSRAPYLVGDGTGEATGTAGPSPAGAPPHPGVVRMLADAQAYIVRIMVYMVKHNQFRPVHASGRVDKQGYDLCKLKADFLNEYKYELDTKAIGFTKVKELVLWLMPDAVDCGVAGMTQSHVVLYPLPTVDYSAYSQLDCNKVLQRVATVHELVDKLQDVKQQVEQYKQALSTAAAAAAASGGGGGHADDVVLGEADRAAAAAVPQAMTSAPYVVGSHRISVRQGMQVPGLNAPLLPEQLQQLQQQLGPKRLLLMYIKRRMLPIRVAARRAATAEAWTEVYMRLDDHDELTKQQQVLQEPSGTGAAMTLTPSEGTTAAAPAATVATKDEEDGSLLQGLMEEKGEVAATASLAAAELPDGKHEGSAALKHNCTPTEAQTPDDEHIMLQGLQQEDSATASAANATPPTGGDCQELSPSSAAAAVEGASDLEPQQDPTSGGGAGVQSKAAAAIAHGILQRQPLKLLELWQGFAAEHPDAAQHLAQATEGSVSADSLTQLVQELITDQQQQLPAITLVAHAAGSSVHGQQAGAGPALVCTSAEGGDLVLVGQLYEQAAAHLLEAGVVAELPLYDFSPGVRLGLASMMMSALPQLSLEAVHATGHCSLEQLLQQDKVFGRLLTLKEVRAGQRVVRMVADIRRDLLALLETRMLQLVGSGLHEAAACCTVPPLAGYRLDRCKQDFMLEYGYQLQQGHFGCQSLKALLEMFPDTCCYKVHQRNTFIAHPSPMFLLRLLLRLLLQPVAAAAAASLVGSGLSNPANEAAGEANMAEHDGHAQQLEHLLGDSTGFSAATEAYPGPPALVASRAAMLDTLAAAVTAASATAASMVVDVPVAKVANLMGLSAVAAAADGMTAMIAAESSQVRVYPPVAVMHMFEAVFGYHLPVQRLGVDHFKQLLLELDGECQLVERHALLDEQSPPANVPGVWLLIPPGVTQEQQQHYGRQWQHPRSSMFNECYNKRLAQGRAQSLTGFEPAPAKSAATAAVHFYSSHPVGGAGGSGALIPALGGSAGINRNHSSADYSSGMGGAGRYSSSAGAADEARVYAARGSGGVSGTLPAGAKMKIMAAVAELLRSKLATVPQAFDVSGSRNHAVPTHMGYCLNDLPTDLLNTTGITLHMDGLGYKNLVQLVGAMPDTATIVFSPDRLHRVFPPKPQAGAPAAAAAAPGTGGPAAARGRVQPPPPPRPGGAGFGAGPGLNPTGAVGFNPTAAGLPGLTADSGGGGPLGLQGFTGGIRAMGGRLGLSPVGGGFGAATAAAAAAVPGLIQQQGYSALQQQQLQLQHLQQQQQLLHQQQDAAAAVPQAQQPAFFSAQQIQAHHHQQQQQQVMRLQQSAQVVAAVAEAAGALGVAPAAVPKDTLAALISAAAAASGQVTALTPEALQQATAALQAIFAGQAAAAAAGHQPEAPQAAATTAAAKAQQVPAAQQQPNSTITAQPAAAAAAAAGSGSGGGPTKSPLAQTPPLNSMVLPGLQETTTKPSAIPAADGQNIVANTSGPMTVPSQQQQQQQGAQYSAAPLTIKAEHGPQQPSNSYHQYQQGQQQPSNPYYQYQQHQQQYTGKGAVPGSQPRPPPRPAGASASAPAAAGNTYPGVQAPAGTTAAAQAAGADLYQQQKLNQQYGHWHQQQVAQQSGQQQQQLAPAAAAAAAATMTTTPAPSAAAVQQQYDQEAYAKWYAEYQKYLHEMAVYQQQMQQYQQQLQQQQQPQPGMAGWKPPMPPDPPPAADDAAGAAAATAAKPPTSAADAAPAALPGVYDYAAYPQAYQHHAAGYTQQAAAGVHTGAAGTPMAYPPQGYGGHPPAYPGFRS